MPRCDSHRSLLAFTLSCGVLLHAPGTARAVCRVVEPIETRGGVEFDSTTMVLYVLAPNQVVDYVCKPDAGGVPTDPLDMDAGVDDAGADDGWFGMPGNGGRGGAAAQPPAGKCTNGGAPQPVQGSVVHMVVQPAVLRAAGRAGLVMPVPTRPNIHAPENPDLFQALAKRVEPRVVTKTEYIEDERLGYQCRDPKYGSDDGGGCGGDDDDEYDSGPVGDRNSDLYDPKTDDRMLQTVMIGDGIVSFERALVTADYDAHVLNASTIDALEGWLDQNGLAHDAEDDAAFATYVAEGAWFVALDVHPSGDRNLAPLVVSFRGEEIPLMHRLQYDTAGGMIVTEAFVMAPYRMQAADGSGETIYAAPAGFGGAAAGFGLASGWLTLLRFTRSADKWMIDSRLTATFPGEIRPEIMQTQRVRIPSSKCPDREGGCFCSTDRSPGGRFAGTAAPILIACLWIGLRGRRRGIGR